jgi:ribosomal protein S14
LINKEIISGIVSVYQQCEVLSFPIDCKDILIRYGYEIRKYSELSERKLKACMVLSEDATTIDGTVYYNDSKSKGRIRFSLMHELGHIILDTDIEKDADTFSSNILAPRMAIHYSKCKNAEDVVRNFDLSRQAAKVAFDDYLGWRYAVSIHGMSRNDKELYSHFYNDKANKFVWKSNRCRSCYQADVYNEDTKCTICKIYGIKKTYIPRILDDFDQELAISRGDWLYGDL